MSGGKAFIFSAPSGSGKTTLVKHLLQTNQNLSFSISACTRPKRSDDEVHGRDYYFLTLDEFEQKIKDDQFVEYEEVYPGSYYGTLKSEIDRIWADGKSVVFDVDVKGGIALKKYFKEKALAVFIKVPTLETLKKRLMARATESPESLGTRLEKAAYELSFEEKFDISLVNNNLEESYREVERLVQEFENQ